MLHKNSLIILASDGRGQGDVANGLARLGEGLDGSTFTQLDPAEISWESQDGAIADAVG